MNKAIKNPISIKLLKIIFTLYFGLALLITVVQIYIEFNGTKDNIINELKSIEISSNKSLSHALWVLDKQQLESISEGIIDLRVITGIEIIDKIDSSVTSKGIVDKSNFISHSFKIKHTNLNDSLESCLADIVLYSNKTIVFERTKTRIFSIIISALIKSVILWFIILWVLKTYLLKPLNKLVENLDTVELSSLDNKIISIGVDDNNELNSIADTFNLMFKQLAQQNDKQRRHEKELEQTVQERTQELQISNDKLKILANTDPLTEIYNRRYFFEMGNKLLAISDRAEQPLTVLMCDIDYFKKINDEYGHATGDEVLKIFVSTVSPLLRESDIFARIGGEEFALIIFNKEHNDSLIIAQRIRVAVENTRANIGTQVINFTISIGLASNTIKNDNLQNILHRADEKLYEAKSNGRNVVCS